MLSRQCRLLQLILGSAVLAAGHFCASLGHAETIVSGAANNLTVEARDTSLQDVLIALGAKFDLRVRGLSSLDRRIEGAYRGSLREVVTHLLVRYDYVMKTDGARIEVIVLGAAKQSETRSEQSQAVPVPTRRRSD